MSKKILTSIDPSEITQHIFSRIYNIFKLSIQNIITPPEPGNSNKNNISLSQNDIENPFSEPLIANAYTPNGSIANAYTPNGSIPKRDSMELLKETYVDK
jgi:hypothetical protein